MPQESIKGNSGNTATAERILRQLYKHRLRTYLLIPILTPTPLVADDLFWHFIKALDWPDNYVGAHNLFGDEILR